MGKQPDSNMSLCGNCVGSALSSAMLVVAVLLVVLGEFLSDCSMELFHKK